MGGKIKYAKQKQKKKIRKKDELIFHILEMSRRVSHNKTLPSLQWEHQAAHV